jgi:V/A-type H+-transporting ATPase subunit C
MSGSPYASSLGRFKAVFPSFLPKEIYASLLNAKDVGEITKILEPTVYGSDIAQAAASYRGAELLEVAINRLFVRRNRMALESAPFAGKPAIQAYLRRWDVQNLGLVFSAKAQGRPVQETELFLVSSRELPAGLFAGTLTLDDFRLLLQQPTMEAIASTLVRFGYGTLLLPLLENYQRTKDIFPLLAALDRDYYQRLVEAPRYFQGDEWTVRQFIQGEIDARNVLLLLKGKDAELPWDEVASRFLDGGTIARAPAQDLYVARGVPELVGSLESRFPTLAEGLERYRDDRSLVGFEAALTRDRAIKEFRRMRTYPLSLAIVFSFLLMAELERADLRRIIYGKLYGISADALAPLLIVPRL